MVKIKDFASVKSNTPVANIPISIEKHMTKISKVPNILRKPVISPTSIPELIPNSSSQASSPPPPIKRLPPEIMVFSVFYLKKFKCLTKKEICDEISHLYSSLTKQEMDDVHGFLNLVPSYLEAQEGSRLAPTATMIGYASLVLKRWMVENLSLLSASWWMNSEGLRQILPGQHFLKTLSLKIIRETSFLLTLILTS